MGVSINPALSSNFNVYPVPSVSQGVVSNVLPPEGEFCLPMQFIFQNAKVWQVDLGIAFGSKNSQLRSLYLDATYSSHDFVVYFPDIGFTAKCKAGYSNLISLPNRRYQYVFYLSLDGQVNDPNDTVNVIATNIMLPPFNTFNLFTPPQNQQFMNNSNCIDFVFVPTLHVGQSFPFCLPSGVTIFTTPPIIMQTLNFQFFLHGVVGFPLATVRFDFSDTNTNEVFRTYTFRSSGKNLSFNGFNTVDYFSVTDNINRIFKGTNFSCGLLIHGTLLQGSLGACSTMVGNANFSQG